MVANAPNESSLVGKEPTVFDGNQSKSEAFIQEFELYMNVNIEAHIIANPYR
jgi:hypothetical protein